MTTTVPLRIATSRSACGCTTSTGATRRRRRSCSSTAHRDHCRNWDWVAEALRDRYHIIAPDLRGHGDSQWMVGGNYGLVDYVYDIAQLIHQRGLAPLRIVAHSLGGHVALQYAGVYPESVEQAGLDRGLGPAAGDAAEARRRCRRRSACGAGSTSCASSPAASRAGTPNLDEAVARMQEANPNLSRRAGAPPDRARHEPERGRHLRLEVRQLRARDLALLVQHRRDVRALVARSAARRCSCAARESWAGDPRADGRHQALPERPSGRRSRRRGTGSTTTSCLSSWLR